MKRMNLATDSLSQQSGPSPEVVPERPKRRSFSAAYKLSVLKRVDACAPGEVGRLLRSEGLYSSYLTDWRREQDEGALSAMSKRRGRKPQRDPKDEEVERLRRENARLK